MANKFHPAFILLQLNYKKRSHFSMLISYILYLTFTFHFVDDVIKSLIQRCHWRAAKETQTMIWIFCYFWQIKYCHCRRCFLTLPTSLHPTHFDKDKIDASPDSDEGMKNKPVKCEVICDFSVRKKSPHFQLFFYGSSSRDR